MSKSKFDILKKDEAVDVIKKAALKESAETEDEFVKILVGNFPKALRDKLKAQTKVTGEAVNSFIRRAALKLAKEENII